MKFDDMKMIGQGNTAEIYAYEANKIIKLFRTGISKKIAMLEYEKMNFVSSYVSNVPKIYDFITCDNRHGIIYERINGKDMIMVMIKHIARVNHYSHILAHTHKGIHECTVDPNECISVKNKLSNDIYSTGNLSDIQKKSLVEYLKNLPDEKRLCHFDFHPGNLMMRGDEPMVIDWMTACIGDPCADVARTYIILIFGELPNANYITGKIVGLFQKHVAKIYYKKYLKSSGLKDSDIDKWMLPVAAARLSEWIPDTEKQLLLDFVTQRMKLI